MLLVNHDKGKRITSIKAFGNSMFPLLHDGDVVYLKKTAFSRLRVNDIVCFKKYGALQTHRIIYKSATYVITKGDNNLKSDGRVYERQIVGRVYQVKRDGEIFNHEDIYLVQSTLYFQEIVKIKKAFEKAGINFVFLKGLPLHLYYEGKHPRRIYADCDILISRKQLTAVNEVMKNKGYQKDTSSFLPTQKFFQLEKTEISYYKNVNGLFVGFDIHLEPVFLMVQFSDLNALYPRKKVDALTTELLVTKRTVIIDGNSFPILSPENVVLYLALHFFHGNLKEIDRLLLLFTATKKLNRQHIDKLIEVIKKYSLENFVYQSFTMLQKFYPSSLPQSFLTQIQPQSEKMQQAMKHSSLFHIENNPRIVNGIQRFQYIFALSPQPFWRKIQILLNVQILVTILWIVFWRLTIIRSRLQSSIIR
jgi:signal peptidase I